MSNTFLCNSYNNILERKTFILKSDINSEQPYIESLYVMFSRLQMSVTIVSSSVCEDNFVTDRDKSYEGKQ